MRRPIKLQQVNEDLFSIFLDFSSNTIQKKNLKHQPHIPTKHRKFICKVPFRISL